MSNYDRVNVALDPEQKGEWDDFIEENHEVESMSQLVRTSVERRMHGEDLTNNQATGDTPATVELDGVEDSLLRMETALEDIQTRLKRLETEVGTQGIPEDVKVNLWQNIPKVEDESQPPEEKGVRLRDVYNSMYEDLPEDMDVTVQTPSGEPQDAHDLDEMPWDLKLRSIEKAIEALERGGATVRTEEVEEAGENVTYVWRPA